MATNSIINNVVITTEEQAQQLLEALEEAQIKKEGGDNMVANVQIIETHFSNGNIRARAYYMNRQRHRTDGPAYEEFNADGSPLCLMWCVHGHMHNENGPAYQWFYSNGQVSIQRWYIHGHRHRLYGPAHKRFDTEGAVVWARYFIDDKLISKKQHLLQMATLQAQRALLKDIGV